MTMLHRPDPKTAIERREADGISLEEQERLFEAQEGRCGVCGCTLTLEEAKLARTIPGKPLGFVCHGCLVIVGMARRKRRIPELLAAFMASPPATEIGTVVVPPRKGIVASEKVRAAAEEAKARGVKPRGFADPEILEANHHSVRRKR